MNSVSSTEGVSQKGVRVRGVAWLKAGAHFVAAMLVLVVISIPMLSIIWVGLHGDSTTTGVAEAPHYAPGTAGYAFCAIGFVALFAWTRNVVAAVVVGLVFLVGGGGYLLAPLI